MIDLLPEPLRALAARLEGVLYVTQNDAARTPIAIGESSTFLFGYTPEELCKEPELFLAHVHPDDRERLRAEIDAAHGATYLPLKYRFIHKSGRVVFCRETQVSHEEAGVLAGVSVDVTELELPQQALQDSLSAHDVRGATLAICEAAAKCFGLSWTVYVDARSESRLFNTHGPLGVIAKTRVDEKVPMEAWARDVHNKSTLAWQADGVRELLSPELRERCEGARFGFAVPVLPEAPGSPAGVLLGFALEPFKLLISYQRALVQLAKQAAVALHRAELTDALQRTSRERQHLSDALVRGHEAERARLARELHDGAGQTLTAVAIQLDLAEQFTTPEGRIPLTRARQQIERTLEELRRLSHALRPAALDDLGLADALSEMAHAMQTVGFTVRVEASSALPPLPGELATGLFRIAQAALTNVVRHAHASRATLRLGLSNASSPGGSSKVQRGLRLEIEDDGLGLVHNESPGMGVVAMRERALALGGRFSLRNGPIRGALVSVWVPL